MAEHNAHMVKEMRKRCREGLKRVEEHEEEVLAELKKEQDEEKKRYLNKRKRTDWDFDDSSDEEMHGDHERDVESEQDGFSLLKSVKCNQFRKMQAQQMTSTDFRYCGYNFGNATYGSYERIMMDEQVPKNEQRFNRLSDLSDTDSEFDCF